MSIPNDRSGRVINVVVSLAEAFRAKVSDATFSAFEAGLDDIPIESIERAALQAVKTMKFFPSVFELRQLCGATADAIPEDRATIAWGAVKKAIATAGTYRAVRFDDPLTNAAVRLLGGWARFGEVPAGPAFDTWLKKEFLQTYETLSRTGITADMAAPLAGIDPAMIDTKGRALSDQPVAIQVGLPPVDSKLIRGMIREPAKLVALPDSAKEWVKKLDDAFEEPRPVRIEHRETRSKEEILEELRRYEAERSGRVLQISEPGEKPF